MEWDGGPGVLKLCFKDSDEANKWGDVCILLEVEYSYATRCFTLFADKGMLSV